MKKIMNCNKRNGKTENKLTLRNIDVLHNINGICVDIGLTSADVDSINEIEQQDIFDLAESADCGLIEEMEQQLTKLVRLLEMLTPDYLKQLDETDFCLVEFVSDVNRIDYDTVTLLEEWDPIMEEVWSLQAFCQTELLQYKQLTQPCYTEGFIDIEFEEDGICHTNF